MWEIVLTDKFEAWFAGLTDDQQNALVACLSLLKEHGPSLGRPTVDSIKTSRHSNMKELRASKGGALRVLFAFDPLRQALSSLAGTRPGSGPSGIAMQFPQLTRFSTSTSRRRGLQ